MGQGPISTPSCWDFTRLGRLHGGWMVVFLNISESGPSISGIWISLSLNLSIVITYILHWLCPIQFYIVKNISRNSYCLIWDMVIGVLEINLSSEYVLHNLYCDIQMTFTIEECHRSSVMVLWDICIFAWSSAPGCVTCHTRHASVTYFRPILGNVVEVTLMTPPTHVHKFPH